METYVGYINEHINRTCKWTHMQNIPHQLQVLWLVVCLFWFTDKILTKMVYITNRFSNMKSIFTHFVIHTLILYTTNFCCYCVILKLCLKNTVRLYFLCVCIFIRFAWMLFCLWGEKGIHAFLFILWKTEYKNYVYLSFRMFFYKQRRPIKIICISVVGGMIVFSKYVKK